MPTISAFYGIVIQMFWREHNPPHFHALYGEYEAVFDLRELHVLRGIVASSCHGACLRMGRRTSR